MPQKFTIRREDIPLANAGSGNLNIDVDVPSLDAPLTPDAANLMHLGFDIHGNTPVTIGVPGSVALAITSSTEAVLGAIFPEHGALPYFERHPNDLLMTLRLGASATAAVNATVRYQALSAQGTVDTGADGGYTYTKPYPRNAAVRDMVPDFVKSIKLPANTGDTLAPGESITYEFGGYVRLGASLSAGYDMQGAASFAIRDLQLSEKYTCGLLGTIGVQAGVAGRFEVEASGVEPDAALPGRWARVTVRKKRSGDFGVAADVRLAATSKLNGLPGSGDEFLGALLGVNARSWLTYLQAIEKKVAQITSVDKLEEMADGLAKKYLEQLVGRGFEEFGPNLDEVLGKVREVVTGYEKLDERAVALFDHYYDRIETTLLDRLTTVAGMQSWSLLSGNVDPDLVRVIGVLSGGDPLSAAALDSGQMLGVVTKAAQGVLGLIQGQAHKSIERAVALAKERFGLDPLFMQVARFDTTDELRAEANTAAGGFVSRLIGETLDDLGRKDLEKALARVREVVAKRRIFEDRLYAKVLEAADQSFTTNLHSEYRSSSEREALLDAMFNLADEQGRALFRTAAEGDFSGVMSGYRPDVVRLLEGTFTHDTQHAATLKVNVIGWHRDWTYSAIDRVIVNTEQHLTAAQNGTLMVYTQLDLTKEKERRSGLKGSEERAYTNFLLRFFGESQGAVAVDTKNQSFLIDVIRAMAARYQLSFTDDKTTPEELKYYLSFARDFGLVESGATYEKVAPMLPSEGRNFGQVQADYDVAFAEAGLRALFRRAIDADQVRTVMRSIVLANYVAASPHLAGVAWCYATPGVRDIWRREGANFDNTLSGRTFRPIATPAIEVPVDVPREVSLDRPKLVILSTLYRIEDKMVEAVSALQALLMRAAGSPPLSPADYEHALEEFGEALHLFDDFDEGVNTVFGLLDQLIRSAGADSMRASSLKLRSKAAGLDVEKVFMKQAADAARPMP